MPAKKRVKSSNNNTTSQAVVAGAPAATKTWETALTAAQLEEDSWRASVSVVVGDRPEDQDLIEALGLAMRQPLRRLFTLLSRDDTLAKIHELGNPKTKKPKDVPMFYEVTEPAKVLLDAVEEIPCELMAKILKFQLLEIKAIDQRRRATEQDAEEKVKGRAGPASASKDKGGAKAPGDKAKKPQASGGPPREKETKLKRRGEDVEPLKYIDDEPDDGPQRYILLVGFHEPQLLVALDAVGVHVANVIKLGSERTPNVGEQQATHSSEGKQNSQTSSPVADAETEVQVNVDSARWRTRQQQQMFWSGLGPVLDGGPPVSKFRDVARLDYTVSDPPHDPLDTQDPAAALALGSRIFEGVACLIYDCLDWRRQYQHYRQHTKLINVPTVVKTAPRPAIPTELVQTPIPTTPTSKKKTSQEASPPIISQEVEPPPLSTDVDMRYYSNLLDLVAPEACSVSLILHCILEQVVSTHQSPPQGTEESSPSSVRPGMDYQLSSHILHSFLPLVRTEEEKSRMLNTLLAMTKSHQDRGKLEEEFGGLPKKTERESEHPMVFKQHDERALRLRRATVCQGFDPVEVESSMMKRSPVWELIHSSSPRADSDPCRSARTLQLLHHCVDDAMSWPEVERALHQSVLESMPLTVVDRYGVLQDEVDITGTKPEPGLCQTPPVFPWDDPMTYAKQRLRSTQDNGQTVLTEEPRGSEVAKSVRCQLDLSDIQRTRLRHLSDWHYDEHHDATVFPQVLQSTSEAYRCMDTFRGRHDNNLYIICHNPMSQERQCKEFWDMALHTDVGFRKYLEHVADAISDWTRQEEAKREAEQPRELSPAESVKVDDAGTREAALESFIRKGSLKAWKMEQEQLKEEELAKKSKKDNTGGRKTPKVKDEKAGSAKDKKDDKKEDKKEDKKDDKKALSSGRKSRARSSSKSPAESVITATVPSIEDRQELHQPEEPFHGFLGYRMDGKLIQVSGRLQYLFPSDGGHVTVETISYVQGARLMKVAVKKDGHHFYTHVNRVPVESPAAPPTPPDTRENKDPTRDIKDSEVAKIVKHGSFSAVLDNGVRLSYSYYGPTGQYTGSPQVPEEDVPETVSNPPVSPPALLPPSNHCPKALDPSPPPTQALQDPASHTQAQVCGTQQNVSPSPFKSLNLSVPNGLLLTFFSEEPQGDGAVMVRQSFPSHGSGLQDPSLSREMSRVVTIQGAVVRYMRDGSTEVLFADGSVSFSPDSGPVWVHDSEVEDEMTSMLDVKETQDNKKGKTSKKDAEPELVPTIGVPTPQRGFWVTTTPSGERISTVGNTHKVMPADPALTYHATDPLTQTVMLTREDQVVSVLDKDGTLTVEHADGTRITSLYQDSLPPRPSHTLLRTGEWPESGCTKSNSDSCTYEHPERACVTRRAQSMCEEDGKGSVWDAERTVSVPCNSGENTGRTASAESARGTEGTPQRAAESSVCQNSEEEGELASRSVRGNDEEEGAFSSETEECENGEASAASGRERVVMVEREGCATVVMYPERRTAHVFLVDGTVATANHHGAYQVFPSSAGLLLIKENGTCVYSSHPTLTPSPESGTPQGQPGSYAMSHTGPVACEVIDPDGNHFQVSEDGQTSAVISSPVESTWELEEEDSEKEEEDGEMARLHVKHGEQSPRLFLVHEDGSGTELLSSHAVEEFLDQAYSDPTVALLKEPLPDANGVFNISILKPSHQSVWSQWLLGKQNPDIIPANLRNRTWHDFPREERKTPGPPLGSDLGVGLTLTERASVSPASRHPILSCPEALELRELTQYPPVTTQLRHKLDTRLKECMERFLQREQLSEDRKVKDPRTEEERVHASDLLKLVLSYPEAECKGHSSDKRTPVDIASLYAQAVSAPALQLDMSSEDSVTSENSKRNESQWTKRIAQHRQELLEDKACREALRNRMVVPYFHPENALLYQDQLSCHAPDMRSVSIDLPPLPKTDDAEAFLTVAPHENTHRPLNPTPSHAASYEAVSETLPTGRPTNPTPQTAGDSSLRGSPERNKSIQLDVTGNPRKTKVKMPSSILGSKPFSTPNQKYLSLEEPVRRRCRTVSLGGTYPIARGFQLLPASADFGTLREGCSYAITMVMKNVGVDTCRFTVKQPPPATGLRVIYNPGPVAAGLHVELQVQLFAMCVVQEEEEGPKNYISQHIVINTETEILYLPVTATVLPETLYDSWAKEHGTASRNKERPGVNLITSTPSVRRGVVLPHRQHRL